MPRTKNRNDSKCNYYRNRENVKRHTYVFSATLTMVHSGPQRIMKKRKKKIDEKQKLSWYFCEELKAALALRTVTFMVIWELWCAVQ